MTRKRSRPVSPGVREAWVELFEGVFLTIMQGMLKATTVEEDYAHLEPDVRQKTQQELQRIARRASEKFVTLANPEFTSASKEQIAKWKVQAMEYALRK